MTSKYNYCIGYFKRCDDQDLEMTQNELEYCFNNKKGSVK